MSPVQLLLPVKVTSLVDRMFPLHAAVDQHRFSGLKVALEQYAFG